MKRLLFLITLAITLCWLMVKLAANRLHFGEIQIARCGKIEAAVGVMPNTLPKVDASPVP
jgi:hypothetical protein